MLNTLIVWDQSVFIFFNSFIGKNDFFDLIIKLISVYCVYLVPIGLLISWFVFRKEKIRTDLLKITIGSVFIWQTLPRIIAHFCYRPRPIAELAGTRELVFHIPSYSFPSDHSTFLAALATYFYLTGYKKVGIYVFIIAIAVGKTRIIAGLHYPGDVLVGWILGCISAYLIFKYLDKTIEKYLAKPMFKIAKFLHLA